MLTPLTFFFGIKLACCDRLQDSGNVEIENSVGYISSPG
jgi:hypothetical protein